MRSFLIGACLLFSVPVLWSQPDWSTLVPEAFSELDQEVADSIRVRRAVCEPLRAEMEKIVTEKGLDRLFIFGPGDTYLKEGMSRRMKNHPAGLQVGMDRDKGIMRLEELNVRLYSHDLALMHWLDIEQRLAKHPDRTQHKRWAMLYQQLPPDLARDLKKNSVCRHWIKTEVACDIVAALEENSPDKASGKVGKWSPDISKIRLDTLDKSPAPAVWGFPLPPEAILISFPFNGQFAFRRDESIPGVGYAAFPKWTREVLFPIQYEYGDRDLQLRARWCSAHGEVTYTEMELREGNWFFFNLPPKEYFQGGELYRLELIAYPKGSVSPVIPDQVCWQQFRGVEAQDQPFHHYLQDEIKFSELYFRAGKYSIWEQIDILQKGVVDWEAGLVHYTTDEPLAPIDLRGNLYMRPWVRFGLQNVGFYKLHEALDHEQLRYYFTVPRVEPIEGVPAGQLLVAEMDNTFGAPFIEDLRKGAASKYAPVTEVKGEDVALPGGYFILTQSHPTGRDTLVTPVSVPFITRAMFEKKQLPDLGMVECTLYVAGFRRLVFSVRLQKEQVTRRIAERSRFLYELERRAAEREGRPPAFTLEEARNRELANLPDPVRLIFEAQYPEVIQKTFTLSYTRDFPGTGQYMSLFQLKYY